MRRFTRVLKTLFPTLLLVSSLSGCAYMRPVETPIPTKASGDPDTAERIFVLLPGLYDDLGSFERRGFLAVARDGWNGPKRAAFVAVDAHYGYYREGSIDRRLKDEVLSVFAGRPVTGVGVSLGGLGVLLTARRYPDLFDRLVLLAPFVGWPDQIERLKQDPDAEPRDAFEAEIFALWRGMEEGAGGLPITVLYGEDDEFAASYAHLSALAPAISFRAGPGGHDWASWNRLWAGWLGEQVAEVTDGGPELSSAR